MKCEIICNYALSVKNYAVFLLFVYHFIISHAKQLNILKHYRSVVEDNKV